MTKNEYIASIMLEAAELLKDDTMISLNEGLTKDTKIAKNMSEEIKNSINFTQTEKDKAINWLNSNSDKIEKLVKLANKNNENLNKADRKFIILFMTTMPTAILPIFFGIIYSILASIRTSNISNTRVNLKTIKRKLSQIDKSKLSKTQLNQFERIMDAINVYEDLTTSKIKIENQ